MLSKILNRFRPATVPTPRIAEGQRLYVVGDIHGRDDLLEQMLNQIQRDAESAEGLTKKLIFLGDYVDRGRQSRDVLERLSGPPPAGFEQVCLRGNHDDTMLRFLEEPELGLEWLSYGGRETLFSYGIPVLGAGGRGVDLEQLSGALNEALPQTHRAFLSRLELFEITDDFLFVHAGIRPGIPIDHQERRDMMWIRDPFLSHREPFEKVVVHGHTVTDQPELRLNRIGIDTGAFASGRLTCLVIEGELIRFLST